MLAGEESCAITWISIGIAFEVSCVTSPHFQPTRILTWNLIANVDSVNPPFTITYAMRIPRRFAVVWIGNGPSQALPWALRMYYGVLCIK